MVHVNNFYKSLIKVSSRFIQKSKSTLDILNEEDLTNETCLYIFENCNDKELRLFLTYSDLSFTIYKKYIVKGNSRLIKLIRNSNPEVAEKSNQAVKNYYVKNKKEILRKKNEKRRTGIKQQGKTHHKFKGLINTPHGVFVNTKDASNAENINPSTIQRRIKSKNFKNYFIF